jgi:4'-phosphopantetheinyl transferase EntD
MLTSWSHRRPGRNRRGSTLLPPADSPAVSISAVVPAGVVWTEQYGQVDGVLLAEEQELLTSRVAPERRREFAAGRSCARSALNQLGLPVGPILRGDAGRPLWPPQAVGSITHCRGYCAAAAAPADRFTALGIDAEINEALPPGVLSYFAGERELRWLASAPSGSLHWDKLLYAIKESVFKAWYPRYRSCREFPPKNL